MIRKWITKSTLHTGIFCLAAIFLSFVIYNITHVFLTHILTYISISSTYDSATPRLAETVGRVFGTIAILLLYRQIFDLQSLGMQRKNFLRGIIMGTLMLFILIGNTYLSFEEISQFPLKTPSLYLILIVIIEQIWVGIFEEFLFRGLILNTLLEKTKPQQYKGMICSLLISSLLFGAVHLLNLSAHPELINTTIAQTIYACFVGVFLGAIYLRSGNIWVVVFYHALIDIVTELPLIFINGNISEGSTDIPVLSLVLNILANSVILFAGLFLARKSKSKYARQTSQILEQAAPDNQLIKKREP